MSATKVKCPNCGNPISAENINIQKMTALCGNCDSVFVFTDLPENLIQREKYKRLNVPTPGNLRIVEDTDERLHMTLKWSIRQDWSTNIAIVGFVFVLALLAAALSIGEENATAWLVFSILLFTYPLYYAGLYALNRTHISIDKDVLSIHTTPLYYPGYGARTVPTDEISGIRTAVSHHYKTMNQHTSSTPEENLFYDVVAVLQDGRTRRLLEFHSYQETHTIAQRLQAHLAYLTHSYSNALVDSDDAEWDDLSVLLADGEVAAAGGLGADGND